VDQKSEPKLLNENELRKKNLILFIVPTNAHVYSTKLYYTFSYTFRCLYTIFRELIYCVCQSYKIL